MPDMSKVLPTDSTDQPVPSTSSPPTEPQSTSGRNPPSRIHFTPVLPFSMPRVGIPGFKRDKGKGKEKMYRYRGHRRNSWSTKDVDEMTELRARQRTFEGAYVRTALGNLSYALIILKIFSPEFAKIGLLYVVTAALLLIISLHRRQRSENDFADVYRIPPQSQSESQPNTAPTKPNDNSLRRTPTLPLAAAAALEERNPNVDEDEIEVVRSGHPKVMVDEPEDTMDEPEDTTELNSTPSQTPSPANPSSSDTPSDTLADQHVEAPPPPKPAKKQSRYWGRAFRTSGMVVVTLTTVVAGLEIALLVLLFKL